MILVGKILNLQLGTLFWFVVERMTNGENYRLEQVKTGKLLDPTNVNKLVKVEPLSINRPHPEQLNPNSGQDTLPKCHHTILVCSLVYITCT